MIWSIEKHNYKNVKEESDIDSLFRRGGTTMLKNDISGLDDFELIAFVAIV